MNTKEVTIAGKQVTLGYCYATEIAYKDLVGENITTFIVEAVNSIQGDTPTMPDIKKAIFAILAAAIAYSDSIGEKDAPIKDTDLMYNASAAELSNALGTVIGLRVQFYHIPEGEPEDKDTTPDDSPSGKRKGRKKNS